MKYVYTLKYIKIFECLLFHENKPARLQQTKIIFVMKIFTKTIIHVGYYSTCIIFQGLNFHDSQFIAKIRTL